MSYIAPKLKHRIEIQKMVQVENDLTGGFDQSYVTLLTIWAAVKSASEYLAYVMAKGGANLNKIDTHIMTVRFSSVQYLGTAYASGFSAGFDTMEDLQPLKRDYFIFLRNGSSIKGRLFQINALQRDEKNREFMKIKVTEIEEQGTGYPE